VSADLDRELRQRVRPLLDRFYLKCHSGEEPEADIDLQRFSSLAEARRGVSAWRKVADVLDKGEMPPPEARQPKAEDRRALRGWVGRDLDFEAKQSAGDPGRIVMRRLSNAEYTRTVRDLNGVPLDPAREFPQDGAAGEGFTNTGDAPSYTIPPLTGLNSSRARPDRRGSLPRRVLWHLAHRFRHSPAFSGLPQAS
jgi:hypothetical protein